MPADRFLEGRHAIVTGGSRGIGAVIAAMLAQAGAALTIMGRDRQALTALASQLGEAAGVAVTAVTCDVADESSVRAAFDEAGPAYVLVNNAGQAEGAPFADTTRAVWDRMLAVNLTGAYLCTQQVMPAMLERGDGRIVNIASTSGLRGYRNTTAYTASKHGLVGFTRALAAEVARTRITVNAVCPAYTDTAMAERAAQAVARDLQRDELEARAMIARTVPRGRLIEPREVAGTVLWLCSPDASGVNGQAITVAGGDA
jgi:NAD(P)-dependent dehydrogenase (short-subunit alcohol dehydrogenase family)